jgi:DnaJ like chaperone protein
MEGFLHCKKKIMANFAKWLGAGLGFTLGGPIGSILGYVVGSVIGGFSKEDLEQARNYRPADRSAQSGDFEISLLLLSAIVIKADGKIDPRELDYVRDHFKRMYGAERAQHAFSLFKGFVGQQQVSSRQICLQIRQHLDHATRLQLLHFLFGIAGADGRVTEVEVQAIKSLAAYLNISAADFESIKAMFYRDADSAYRILEIDPSASDEALKKAYRKMVKKYHPDKLQHLGDAHVRGAEEKFKQVQKAYEQLKQERGI